MKTRRRLFSGVSVAGAIALAVASIQVANAQDLAPIEPQAADTAAPPAEPTPADAANAEQGSPPADSAPAEPRPAEVAPSSAEAPDSAAAPEPSTETQAEQRPSTIPVTELSKPKEEVAKPDDTTEVGLEKIVVTASKLKEDLNIVPGAVSVLTGDRLKRIGATSFQDFATYLPGVSSSSNGVGANQIVIRGVATGGSQQSVSSTVGVYVDELPVGSSSAFAFGVFGLDLNPFDLDRVELLSGPQGTLYGAGSLGGLLKYVTTPPNPHVWTGTFRGDASRPQTGGLNWSGRGMLNAPIQLGDVAVGLRADGFADNLAGFISNPSRGLDNVDASKALGGRGSVLASLTSDLDVRLAVLQQKITRDGNTSVDYDPHTREPVNGEYDQSTLLDEPFASRLLLYTGTIKWTPGSAELTSASGWQISDLAITTDQTPALGAFQRTGNTIPYEVFVGSRLHKFTQEIRLAASGSLFDWQVGGFWTFERAYALATLTGHTQGGNLNGLVPGGVLPIPVALPLPDLGSIPQPFPDQEVPFLVAELFTKYREGAGFGNLILHFGERLDVILGARYAVNLQEFRQQTAGILGTIPSDNSPRYSRDGVATYLINPRYRFADSSILYARVASGYRPGGPNFVVPPPFPPAPPIYTPDRVWNYELGVKAELGSRASVNFSVYYIDWSDIQLLVNVNSLNTIANAGTARVVGAELAGSYLVASGLTIGGNLSYSKATLTEDSPELGAQSGAPLPLSPRISGALTGDYRFPLTNTLAALAGISYRYVGERPSGFDGSTVRPQYWLDGYSMLDLRSALQWQNFDIALYLRNVLDVSAGISADTSALQYNADAPVRVTLLQPRTVGLTLTYRIN